MGKIYENITRPFFFRFWDPEKAHDSAVKALSTFSALGGPILRTMEWYNQPDNCQSIELFGLNFPNAVGLAAGMDKNGQFWRAMPALGFGHVEIGTITHHAQEGNPKPRLFRYPDHEAIINRMGFNNAGAEAVAKRLKAVGRPKKAFSCPLGINIGKSRVAPLEDAIADYIASFNILADYADFITLNVSSPNTPKLRELQGEKHLPELLSSLRDANCRRAKKLGRRAVPMLLKIAPDLTFGEIDAILESLLENEYEGIVATNTTISRPSSMALVNEEGGLSGSPLRTRSLEVVNYISRATDGKLPIIGVGGIDSPASAAAMMDAGASLVQLYSGMIYRGPFVAKDIARGLSVRHQDWV